MNKIILIPIIFVGFACSHQTIINTAPQRAQKRPHKGALHQLPPNSVITGDVAQDVKPSIQPEVPSELTETSVEATTELVSTDPVPAPQVEAPDPQEKFGFLSSQVEQKPEKKYSEERFAVNSKKIGVILPITGRNSNLSTSILEAVRMGLGISLENPGPFSIAIYDSQGSPELAAAGVEKLLRDENVVAVLGGLSSKEAEAISSQAEFFRVPFITFSQKSGLTENTQYTFRNAITSEMQVKRLVEYAYTVLGARRFGLLYPNDAYGVEFANLFWDHVLARGGSITAAQGYDPKETNLSAQAQKLVGTYHVDARKEEFEERKKELIEKHKKRTEALGDKVKKTNRENEAKENILPPEITFDALFLPDSSRALGQALAFMKSADATELTFLGTNLWNTSELSRRVGPNQSKVLFVDSFNPPEVLATSAFYQKYLLEKQVPPTLLDAQTYEAASILRGVLEASNMGREALSDRLSSLGRRPGAYSELVMSPEHELERSLSILTLDHTQNENPIKKID
jgi:branched-chain amino acid transport system substrate-binding protein